MKKTILFPLFLFLIGGLRAQEVPSVSDDRLQSTLDSIHALGEITILAETKKRIETDLKMGISVDEFLASSDEISFIKRGAYAWEPLLNNMSSERSTITIDGMHVFGACTDKMDPITSYVESNNLSSIDIKSGQEGSMHGATVAGSIDLKSKSTPFGRYNKWAGSYQTGFEANNHQLFNLGNVSFSSDDFVADAGLSLRNAGNYSDGNNEVVKHSQYNKLNAMVGLGYKTSPFSSLKASVIFDRSWDVGFPALPMDVWLSRALITSVAYKQLFSEGLIKVWDTKVYFNALEHYMDDTKRPENLVHMDMPGWSTTYGVVSKLSLKKNRFHSEVQVNAYQNRSIAEMTMYPQDRSKKTMFAYTWPWVATRFVSLAVNNSLALSDRSSVDFGASLGHSYAHSKYAEFNWIFHPGAPQSKNRLLPGLHAGYNTEVGSFDFSAGLGYGHRAPSVSEAYGYYIYNSFDRYDYVGNPDLKNEISYEVNAGVGYAKGKWSVDVNANYFYIRKYIIGKILSLGSPMNYQSVGVKGYTSLKYAQLFNLSLRAAYDIADNIHWRGGMTYARATDNKGGNLPFIRPLSYETSLHYGYKNIGFRTSVSGDFAQVDFSPEYGEDQTPAYTIWNLSLDYTFDLKENKSLVFQVGAENILNKFYSTYADWGNIPRMGRNIFTSLKFEF